MRRLKVNGNQLEDLKREIGVMEGYIYAEEEGLMERLSTLSDSWLVVRDPSFPSIFRSSFSTAVELSLCN